MNQNYRLWAVIHALALIATITVNALASILPLNGMDTGQLSDMYPNLFVPAGLTFAIWAVIYFLLIGFVIYSLVQAFSASGDAGFLREIGPFFLLLSMANIGWIFAWHWTFTGLSLLIMLCLLATLIAIYLRLKIGLVKRSVGNITWVSLPFSVYLGWITVATIANVTAFLVDIGWNGFGISEAFWAAAVIAAGTIITLAVVISRRDVGYALVVLWAFYGIYLKRSAIGTPTDTTVEVASLVGITVITLGTILRCLLHRLRKFAN